MTERRCQKCGTPVATDALFCSRCGVDVTVVSPADAPTVEMPVLGGGPSPRVRSTMRQTLRDATLGEYEILEELGRGGMATVFLAHDIALDRKVAIKVMAPHLLEGEGMAERFKQEARTAAQLSHPHIIPIYAVRETEATLFFVMKYVEGKTLDEIIKRTGPMPIPMIKDVLAKVGAALGYAHRRNVIHRDVKPGNIMIDEEGTPIVTDFGIAKVTQNKGLTMTGTTIGTPAYMSPEQCEAKPVTGASDQYSLGVVAWEMLTGKTPFSGDSAVTTMYKHCHEALPPLRDFRPDAPPEVADTVTRMLAKNPAERWPSLEAAVMKLDVTGTASTLDPIRSQLLELASQPEGRELIARISTPRSPMPGVSTGGATPASMVQPPAKKRSPVLAAAAVVVLAVGGGALAVLRPWEQGADVPPAASAGEVVSPADPPTGDPEPAGGDGAAGGGTTTATPPPADGAPPGTPTTATGGGAATPPPVTSNPPPAATPRPAPTVASIRIGGVRSGLEPGDPLTLTATALDGSGQPMSGQSVRWTSNNSDVGRVGADDGSFTAVAAGSVVVTATIGSVSERVTIEVGGPSVASVALDRSTLSLTAGERAVLAATVRDRSGGTISSPVSWSSANSLIASVSGRGEVVAEGPGQTTITASAGERSATVSVSVAAAPVEARAAVPDLIAAYARALESRDIAQVRQAYPGMTQQQESAFRTSLPNLQSATLNVESIDEQGDAATAMVRGEYVFVFDGRRQASPVSFRATFERAGTGWRMTRTE
jgi:serine/threonine protein kinase